MLKPPPNRRNYSLDDPEHLAPRPTGAWGLIPLTPATRPLYVCVSQSQNCAGADHRPWEALPLTWLLKTLCWSPKSWCFRTVVLEKTLESPLDCKEIQPVHPKGDQSWVFIGWTDVEAETPVLVATWWADSFEKTLMLGKTEGRRRRGQQRMRWLDWHHPLNGHEFGWTLGVGVGQGGLLHQSSGLLSARCLDSLPGAL